MRRQEGESIDTKEEEQSLMVKQEKEEVDGGLGWLVVFACFLTTFVLDGIGYSFGMFMNKSLWRMSSRRITSES